MVKVKEELVDKIAELEVQSLLLALQDPELRTDPSILARVRSFLKDNKLITTPETPGVQQIQKATTVDIPDFDEESDSVIFQ